MAENWTLAHPIDHTKIGDLPAKIRNVKTLVVSGMARIFAQSAAPTTKYDGTAFAADDDGSIWLDTDDDKVYILTAYATPTWTSIESVTIATLLAAARTIAFANATLTLQNTTHEDGDGGRDSKLIFKGEQSGGEATTLGWIEMSHEGTGDDQKGQLIFKINDGDDSDAPSKQPIGFQSTGKIDVANSLSVLDEDNMASDDAEVLATQQSIKAFVDAADAGTFANLFAGCGKIKLGTYTGDGNDSGQDVSMGASWGTPDVVIVLPLTDNDSQLVWIKTSNMGTGYARGLGTDQYKDNVLTLAADKFTVGGDATDYLNNNTESYAYIAIELAT